MLRTSVGIPRRAVVAVAPRLLAPKLVRFASPMPVRFASGGNLYEQRALPRSTLLKVVPQQQAWVIERFGTFDRVLYGGLNIVLPVIDKVAYVHSLKEEAISIPNQTAITSDNVTITIDGVLYTRVTDPRKASYGISNLYYSITQIAQTTMRSELGRMTLDKTFAERRALNEAICSALNEAAASWGLEVLRYEIRDILPPASVKQAMDLQAEAERKKRAHILDSEGQRQAEINVATGQKEAITLEAEGEAAATLARARATAAGIDIVAQAIARQGGSQAVALRVAEQYVAAFSNLAQKSTTLMLPANVTDPASMVAQAMSIYSTIGSKTGAQQQNASEAQDASASLTSTNSDLPTWSLKKQDS